ncbi:MAG: HU family DNA-binding protein [Gammaproteobacteria bacterium]|nr:MAG: HU family DNA-binding protein [Gammaproteobacteria bacterium]
MASKTLSKSDLIDEIAKANGDLTKKAITEIVNSAINVISTQVAKGNEVNVIGFGKFHRIKRKARKGRNPATGEEIKIAATNAPKFTPGKALKNAVSKKK